ncbi:MAG: hypothetical protein WCC17_25995 [Candidatus Nitrosopolaris sp.]
MSEQSERLHRRIYCHAARRSSKQVFWTNPSVNAISGDEDSISVITKNAKDDGWPKIKRDSTDRSRKVQAMVFEEQPHRKRQL